VLYHRREPLQHVKLLRDNLRCGGQLVLETLVLPAGYQWPRHPVSRYANMRNVWYLPELSTLQQLLRNSGFREVRIVSISHTSGREQRGTNWMTFHSLAEALDQRDDKRTIEGHPAPCRAIVTAIKP